MKKRLMKLTALLATCAMLALSLAACGEQPAPAGSAGGNTPGKTVFTVGICQITQHDALDAATKGFRDALVEELGEDAVIFDEQNASGDSATCATICNGFVSDGVDLIMANATPALQAAAASTDQIPILGTSISTYGAALDLKDFNGIVGGNISGTSDLAPLDQQAQMLTEIFPNAKTVGIIYCSSEANSVYQADEVEKFLTEMGLTVNRYTFADSNDVSLVTQEACDANDVLYIPTDNVAANCADAIDAVAKPANTPIVAGEEGLCKGCGVVTLTIDYYELGRITGKMAAKVLTGEEDISQMPIEYFPNTTKKVNPANAALFGVTVPDDYIAVEE